MPAHVAAARDLFRAAFCDLDREMPCGVWTPDDARRRADVLFRAADAAETYARAIHDAWPDQVCGNCLGRRFVDGPGELFAVNCPTCNPPAPGAAPAFRQDNDAGPAEVRNRWA